MCLFSYFWDSAPHLEAFTLVFESIAGIVELIIAICFAVTVFALRSEPTEKNKRRKDKLEAALGLIAGVFFAVAIATCWRIFVLSGRERTESQQQFSRATNELEAFKLQNEGIQLTEKQKKDFKDALGPLRGKFVIFFTSQDRATVSFAGQIKNLMETNGFSAVQTPSLQVTLGPQVKGIILGCSSPTNPIWGGNLQYAFKRMGFNAVGSIDRIDPNDPNVVSILIGIQEAQNSK